jgi:dUTP pyrophosphatase
VIYLINSSFNETEYKTINSAGFDICAAEDVDLPDGSTKLVGTMLFLGGEIERGKEPLMELQIRSRSSMAKIGIVVANSPGTIDADYRDEIKVLLRNESGADIFVCAGDRIAQGVFCAVFNMPGVPIKQVTRQGGFGSTNESGSGEEAAEEKESE